ncbi:MAG: OmpA family protein [Gammaproteobacteria bacterium]|nr:OmpA family protein [Gammaproteobacteria bacterium]
MVVILKLSQRRADTVKSYLMQAHRVPAQTLITVGFGAEALLNGRDPYAPENRRVQFRAAPASAELTDGPAHAS